SLHVTQPMLSSLPFVPAKTWKHVVAEGDTLAVISLRYQDAARNGSSTSEAERPVHYRIDLTPRSAKVHVTSIDLDGDEAAGQVLIEDKVVRLREVSARAASGAMGLEADMDFRRHPYELNFSVTGREIEVANLPAKWKLPPLL